MPHPVTRTVSDFSSPTYWSTRFHTEKSFEWLLPSSKIVPLILEYISFPSEKGTYRGLHLGCGTSDLGAVVERALQAKAVGQVKVEVVDSDYVAETINLESAVGQGEDWEVRNLGEKRSILPLDCLDINDLTSKSHGWDFIIDKSTADAISCGPLINDLEPLILLLRNMAKVTPQGTRWISISYSANRYDCLLPTRDFVDKLADGEDTIGGYGWKVLERRFLASTSLPEGRRWKDDKGVERVVYEPETGVWGWVLERT